MNKVLKGLVAVAASAAMAVAGMFGAGTAMAANTYQILCRPKIRTPTLCIRFSPVL